ncbi:MAG: hypothetical protein HY718_11560 [Planctomycetes bacterium]|nr:hypothetical protein [Planctomycetota bacterium]
MMLVVALAANSIGRADSAALYGIHWWGYTQGQSIDQTPATLLDCPAYGGWDLETLLTHEGYFWGPWYILPLYAHLATQQNMTVITRVDYRWSETVPAPGNPDSPGWPAAVVDLVNTLADFCHIWVIGNEPNHIGAYEHWPDGTIPPADYAAIYRSVRNAIHTSARSSRLGPHVVLFTPVAPNPTSNDWLAEAIDAVPHEEIDGFAIHAYARMWISFHDQFASQLQVIDAKGLRDRPVYMTEMGIYAQPGNLTEEAAAAAFCREAFADVNTWNQGLGHHNIIGMTWFVYDSNQQNTGIWNPFSVEYYLGEGYPLGDPNDLFTAFEQTVDMRYPAGLVGTRGWPVPADFDRDGDVDAADFDHFRDCATGPAIPQWLSDCLDTRLDSDVDVDQMDFAIFQRCFSGQGRSADPLCRW